MTSEARFTVLSLNLWNINPPLSRRMERLTSFLKEYTPDFVALQEVSALPNGTNQAEWIADACGYASCLYSTAGYWEGREEGLAVLSNHRLERLRVVMLPVVAGDMQRIAQLAAWRSHLNRRVHLLVNTHLAYHPSRRLERLKQIDAVLGAVSETLDEGVTHALLCGDLNDVPSSPAVKRLFGCRRTGFSDAGATAKPAPPEDTFSATNPFAEPSLVPGRRIDYVAFSAGYQLVSYRLVLRERQSLIPASDHYGVLAEFEEVEGD